MSFKRICGVDLGSDTIKICDKNQKKLLCEKNMIAVRNRTELIGVGQDAFEIYEKAPALLYHGTHCRTSVLFYFCAIHLTPAEEGEFLLCYVKNSLQLTITEYLTSVRMEHAYTDLITTDYSIREISENNGFSSYAFFVRKFKEAYRTTPLKVRKASEL